MRILAVATLVSPLGEYGGPVRVAVNQCRELARRGHDVTLAAGARGFPAVPEDVDGVPARLFPARTVVPRTGFAGLASPQLDRWLRTEIRAFDVVHVHLARDLVTLPAARLASRFRVPYLAQTHGMIDPSRHPLAVPLDIGLTRRVLHGAAQVLHLTDTEQQGLLRVAGPRTVLSRLPNGVPLPPDPVSTDIGPGGSPGREVLYLARLAPRKRPGIMLDVADELHADFPDVRFTVVGPDEGEGDRVRARGRRLAEHGVPVTVSGSVPPERTLARMRQASVYVLPSVDEPFPMSVLEAMSLGLPVVITDTCGLAPAVRESEAGIVVGSAAHEVVDAVRALLADRATAARYGENARRLVADRFSIGAVVDRLEEFYRSAAPDVPTAEAGRP